MEPYIGQIMLFAGSFAPVGWASCNGQLLPISGNETLYTLLGTTYGGNGTQTFGIPDLRGRIPVHSGQGPSLTNIVQGTLYGSEANLLTIPQIPAHTHVVTGTIKVAASSGSDEDIDIPTGAYLKATPGINTYANSSDTKMGNSPFAAVSALSVSGGTEVPNVQPTLVMNYCIATVGIYPTKP